MIGTIIFILACFGIPAVSFAYFFRRNKSDGIVYGAGMLAFFLSQMVIRIPLLNMIGQFPGITLFRHQYPVVYTFLLSLSAGIFEETARYIAFRFICRKRKRRTDAIVFGFGHGGMEAIFLVGINGLVSLISLGSVSVLGVQLAAAGIERIGAILFHISASVIVYRAVSMKKPGWLLIAIGMHGFYNFIVVMISGTTGSVIITELAVCLLAGLAGAAAWKIYGLLIDSQKAL